MHHPASGRDQARRADHGAHREVSRRSADRHLAQCCALCSRIAQARGERRQAPGQRRVQRRRRCRDQAQRARVLRLKVGIDIPSREDIRRVLAAASNERERAFFMVAAFSGLRASELRGLRWADADLKNGRLHVRQRALASLWRDREPEVAGRRAHGAIRPWS